MDKADFDAEIARLANMDYVDYCRESKEAAKRLSLNKRELDRCVKEAKRNNPGYNAVSVWSEMKDDHSVATVTLVKDNDWKTAVVDLTVYRPLIKE